MNACLDYYARLQDTRDCIPAESSPEERSLFPVLAVLESIPKSLLELRILLRFTEVAFDLHGSRAESARDEISQLCSVAQLVRKVLELCVEKGVAECGSATLADTDAIGAKDPGLLPPAKPRQPKRFYPPLTPLEAIPDRIWESTRGGYEPVHARSLLLARYRTPASAGASRTT